MNRSTQVQLASSNRMRTMCMDMAKAMFIKKRMHSCGLGEMGK